MVTPAKRGSLLGNRVTAGRWRGVLSDLGHAVTVADRYQDGPFDLLIALHARKSHHAVVQFHKNRVGKPIIVAMTGTDLHCDLGRSIKVEESLSLADRVLLLEPIASKKLAAGHQKKIRVIYQSASLVTPQPQPLTRWFEVTVIGHLRSVKDPFRTAHAAHGLPDDSRIRIVQIGRALNPAMEKTARSIADANPRYRFLGALSHSETQRRLARSRVTVLSSKSEGGPAVLSEAIVNSVPVLASRIDATEGILGETYKGMFNVGDTRRLTELLWRAESEPSFRQQLVRSTRSMKQKLQPEFEVKAWKKLVCEFGF
ncbi:TIGR04348 family glycosyltransferase [Mariniblastus sp.]|nr:TIGR04348 family glycosyltransferase [Mariniblastus sp.]